VSRVMQVRPRDCHRVWNEVEPFVTAALDEANTGRRPEYGPDNVRSDIVLGRQHLFCLFGDDDKILGSATVSIVDYAFASVAVVTTIGGRIFADKEKLEQFEHLLRLHGATKIQGFVRPSVKRLWSRVGFTSTAEMVEKEI